MDIGVSKKSFCFYIRIRITQNAFLLYSTLVIGCVWIKIISLVELGLKII
jgi:hypothetical protein